MVVAAGKQIELDSIRRSPHAPPPASGPDRPSLHRRERSSPVKNRKLEICTSGSVGGRGGNTPTYPARTKPLRVALRAILDRFCARRPLIPCGSGRGNGLPRSNKETDVEKYR